MDEFFVENRADETGAHLVHTAECDAAPVKEELRWLGVRSNAEAPLKEAANWFGKSAPCPKCMAT